MKTGWEMESGGERRQQLRVRAPRGCSIELDGKPVREVLNLSARGTFVEIDRPLLPGNVHPILLRFGEFRLEAQACVQGAFLKQSKPPDPAGHRYFANLMFEDLDGTALERLEEYLSLHLYWRWASGPDPGRGRV